MFFKSSSFPTSWSKSRTPCHCMLFARGIHMSWLRPGSVLYPKSAELFIYLWSCFPYCLPEHFRVISSQDQLNGITEPRRKTTFNCLKMGLKWGGFLFNLARDRTFISMTVCIGRSPQKCLIVSRKVSRNSSGSIKQILCEIAYFPSCCIQN